MDEDNRGSKREIVLTPSPEEARAAKSRQQMLIVSFLLMIVIGLGNKIFQKLQTIPMHNYPYFLNLFTTFIYVPLSFAYIWPMLIWGSAIGREQREIPWYKFAVMGILDGIAGIMQTFAVNYIPSGSLIILLMQSAIPISMLISKVLLKARYDIQHYIGAAIVVVGLAVVLAPQFIHPDNSGQHVKPMVLLLWCGVLIGSCIPMTLSSVYKEKALGETEIDVVYLNGWVAVYQFLISLPLAIPSAYASNIPIKDLPDNVWNGMRCFVGKNSIHHPYVYNGQTIPVDDCAMAPIFVSAYLVFNVTYNILIIMILKYGSSNLLWLAMTIMVPLGNFAFALPFVPGHKPLHSWDIVGLVVIMSGLIIFRFWGKLYGLVQHLTGRKSEERDPLLSAN